MLNRIFFALTASLGALSAQYASAQDWSGLYVGASVSAHGGTNTDYFNGVLDTPPAGSTYTNPADRSGNMVGLHFGYRFQNGNFVFGPELSYSKGNLRMEGLEDNKITQYKTVMLKGGYAIDRVLLSAGIGYFEGDLEPRCVSVCGVANINGLALSVGADLMVTESVTLGAVITRREFDDAVYPLLEIDTPGFRTDGDDTAFEFRVGYKF